MGVLIFFDGLLPEKLRLIKKQKVIINIIFVLLIASFVIIGRKNYIMYFRFTHNIFLISFLASSLINAILTVTNLNISKSLSKYVMTTILIFLCAVFLDTYLMYTDIDMGSFLAKGNPFLITPIFFAFVAVLCFDKLHKVNGIANKAVFLKYNAIFTSFMIILIITIFIFIDRRTSVVGLRDYNYWHYFLQKVECISLYLGYKVAQFISIYTETSSDSLAGSI